MRLKSLLMSLVVLAWLAGTNVYAQTAPEDGDRPQQREGRRGQRGGDEGGRGQRGGFGDRGDFMRRMMNATPEERREMQREGWVQMLTRTYDLDDSQQETVRKEVTKISDEYRASLGADAEKLADIENRMADFWKERMQNQPEGDRMEPPFRDEKFRSLMEEMRSIQEAHPFDFEAGAERIESLLPPEQAAKGRERREQWQQRREQFQGQRGERGDGEEGDRNARRRGDRGDREEWRNMSDEEREARREEMRKMMEERRARRDSERSAARESTDTDDANKKMAADAAKAAAEAAQRPQAAAAAGPVHPWERYTQEFITKHGLSETQTSSANAILKQMRDRETATLRQQASAREAAEKLTDAKAKAAKLTELNKPNERTFEELKKRLDNLLTAEQRSKAGK